MSPHPCPPRRTRPRDRTRWAAGALAGAVTLGAAVVVAPQAAADVRAGRAIEIFHGRNIVSVGGYPPSTPVEVEVLRGQEVIGFATYTTDATGFFEINHVGDGDCWQSPYTPNILPGDLVRTTVQGEPTQDSSVTRDVFVAQDATFLPGNLIRVTGHARSTPAAPITGGDQVEVRMNKVNRANGWDNNGGRFDLRLADVRPHLQADGSFVYDFAVSADDWADAQTNGIDISTVYLHGVTDTAEATELTFYDGEPEATVGCPPLLPDDRVAPSQVTGVVVTQPAPGVVELDWAAASDEVGVTGYVVTRTDTGTGAVATYPVGNELFWAQTRVPTGRYSFTVHAVDAAGNAGPKSTEVLVGVGVDAPPAAPTGLTATVTGSSIALSWTAPVGGTPAVSYQVLRGTTVVAEVVTGTAYTDADRPVGTHSYTVRSRAADGALSAASAPASGEVLTPPDTQAPVTGTLAGTRSGTTATLTWSAATDDVGVTGYRVFRDGAQVGADLAADARTATDPGLAEGTYSYTLRAFDAVGNVSDPSNAVSLTIDVTPPTVGGRTPASGATAVAVGSTVTATFSEAVLGVSGTTVTLRPTGGTADVGAAVSFDGTTRTATLDPAADLAAGTGYTVTLTGGGTAIRDLAGNPLTTTSWTFTTAAAAAPNPAPTLSARAPRVDGTSVGVGQNVTATFSEAVEGVSGTSFQLRDPAGTVVPAVVSRKGTTNQWILNPDAALRADTRYTVTLTGGTTAIRDLAGAAFATTSWSFTTGPAPKVTARTPAVNATGVARGADITVTFSEAVQGVDTATFYLRTATGTTNIAATVTRKGTTNQWILNPGANLGARTRYRVTVDGGTAAVRDLAGNPLADVRWTFTTGA